MTEFRWADADTRVVAPLLPTPLDDDAQLAHAYAAAVWSCLVEPGDRIAGALVSALGPEAALREVLTGARGGVAADAAGLSREELRGGLDRWRPRLDREQIAFAIRAAVHARVHLVTPADERWPSALTDLGPYAPLCLWVRGDPRSLSRIAPAYW